MEKCFFQKLRGSPWFSERKLIAPCTGIWIPESWKFLLVKSGMQGFGLQNAALGIRNSSNKWNPSFADKDLYLESGIHGLESGIQEVDCLVFPYVGRKGSKRITRCILDMFLPESSLSASSVSTAVSVASSESSSVKSVLSLSISSFDSRSLSSSKEKKIQVYLGRSPYPPPPPPRIVQLPLVL